MTLEISLQALRKVNIMQRMEILAPAKINLFLDVLGKRPDGYHNIKSIVLPVSVYDRIVLENQADDIVTVAPSEIHLPGIPWPMSLCPPAENLATRAARLLQETTGYRGGVRIVLEKNIPLGAGLGGGSSDAAAVLKGLNELWQTGFSLERLMTLGAQLGCDIPAFIQGGCLCLEGTGERLKPVRRSRRQPLWLLLVYPGFAVSTSDIYARCDAGLTVMGVADKFQQVADGLEQGLTRQVATGLYNALQPTVLRKYPLLELLKNKLETTDALGVELTGSGSTLYALVENAEHGNALAERLRANIACPVWTSVAQAI
ncbi:MAG: 4-(cytidine 5'-diphospho)-2-C-methyl-D-erythritol kinase [Lentisphaerae bacterium]|nr:4-(cytidine 5'-diphospho)-2-C-methyl-D-erythritol kinase [Lentisphaerota bacterium]